MTSTIGIWIMYRCSPTLHILQAQLQFHLDAAWHFPALYSSHRLPSFFPCALHTYFPVPFSVHVNFRYFAALHLQPAWVFPTLHSSHRWPSFLPCALHTYFPALFFCPRDLWSWWPYRNQEAHCKRGSCPLRSPNSFVPKKFWKTRRSWSRGIVSFLIIFLTKHVLTVCVRSD